MGKNTYQEMLGKWFKAMGFGECAAVRQPSSLSLMPVCFCWLNFVVKFLIADVRVQ